jgi:phosphatidylserine decarboxylase
VFAREGYLLIAGAAVLSGILVVIGLQLGPVWRTILCVLAAAALAFTLYFFRDPERSLPPGTEPERVLVAPADGKIVEVVQEEEPHYLEGPSTRVSIFLSPLDVHVNRIPASGVIEFERYVPGDYLVAWHPKASAKNERSELGLQHPDGHKIFFKQIAGAVARRIVYHVRAGDAVQAGERFGIVKFGSRMDVHVPAGVALDVEVGERVRAGESILGRFPVSESVDASSSPSSRESISP